RLDVHEREPDRDRRASPPTRRRRSARALIARQPTRFRRTRAPRRPAIADRARRGRPALRLRPRLLRYRRRTRIERDRRPPGGLGRHSPPTTEGASMNAVSPDLDRRFRNAAADEGLLDVALLADFNRRVLRELARVPYGEVVTYGELAARSARPRAARAVGMVMNRNPLPILLPCHRVIGANGKLTGYAGGLERKETL